MQNKQHYDDISRRNLASAIQSNVGRKQSEDTIAKRADSLKKHYAQNGSKIKGRKLSDEHKNHIAESWGEDRKKEKSDWMKDRIKNNPDIVKTNTGKKFSQDTKDKMSKSMSDSWVKRPLTQCPHCDKMSKSASNMKRWHFDNCKEKK